MYPENNMNSLYSLTRIFLSHLTSGLENSSASKDEIRFPLRIGPFQFVSEIPKTGPKYSYRLALYLNSSGKKAFAKLRSARVKGYHYYSLKNEIAVYKALNSVCARNKAAKIKIPRLLAEVETPDYLLLLLEYFNGQTAESLTPSQKIKLYFSVSDYLQLLGDLMTKQEKSQISSRTPYNLAFLFPILLLKSIFNYPFRSLDLFRGSLVFIKNFPVLKKNFLFRLIHRDLHFSNIILQKNKAILIDFQQCVFTDPLQEYVTTLRYFWKDGNFYKQLLHEILVRNSSRQQFPAILRSLMANSAIHGLTDNGFPERTIINWFDFLKFAVNYG